MPGAYGGTVAAPVWHDIMLVAMRGLRAMSLPPVPAPEQARVPDVVGMDQQQAVQVLVNSHFTPLVESVPSGQPSGVVVGQSPAGGTSAVAGSQVAIRVSNGQAPGTRVPDVVGLPEGAATARLRAAGFTVEVQHEATDDKKLRGIVGFQAPGADADLAPGSTVAIIVYEYRKPKD
jgi:eukaryotic-like serine/threonine-protein kinase